MLLNSKDGIEALVLEQRALAILRLLEKSAGYRSNKDVLKACLFELGFSSSQEDLEKQLSQLEVDEAIYLQRTENIIVIELRAKGQEIAQGLVTVDGVAKPQPGCSY